MHLPVFVLAACVTALTAACSGTSTGAAKRSLSSPVLTCAGVSARVPAGWHGRARIGNGGVFTVTLATFPLVAETDDVDEQSAKRMSRADVLVLLLGYGHEQAGDSPFQTHVRLPLTVQRMTVYGQFEHLPADTDSLGSGLSGRRRLRRTGAVRHPAYASPAAQGERRPSAS
jgi:hypothetical protein